MINTVCTHVCYNDKVHIKVDFDDVTNKPDLVTRDEIVTEFKTINGQEITGTGNIEISGGSGETIDTSNFATKDDVNTLSNNITNNYALKSEIPSLDGYAKTTDIPDTSNLATKAEIVKDFKTINGQEITGTGNIEISADVDTSNFVTKSEMSNYPNRNSNETINAQWYFDDGIFEYGSALSDRYMSTNQQFKTINGETILGEGDIAISGGSGGSGTSLEVVNGSGFSIAFATKHQYSELQTSGTIDPQCLYIITD